MNDTQIQDYTTYARTFKEYKWYKPLLTIAVTVVIYLVFMFILTNVFVAAFGQQFITNMTLGYEGMNYADAANVFGFLILFMFVPSLYAATRIVKDRPFSSYSSSRGGWDWKIFFKALAISVAVLLIVSLIDVMIEGNQHGQNKLTAVTFIIFLIIIPLQCIGEEYLFRGLIMQTLGSWINIPIAAVIVQSIFFAALHPYNGIGIITVLCEGIVLGFVAWKTNGLEANSALHSANNLFTQYFTLLGVTQMTSQVSLASAATGLGSQIIAAAIILYIGKKYGWFVSQE